MALIKCDFFSEVLNLNTSMTAILPQQPLNKGTRNNLIPTLYLLHGFSDDHTGWTRRTSIERYAEKYDLAVIMPEVDHSYYTNMYYGKDYWTFVSEEVPHVARSLFPLSEKREENFVAGLSMGGYGAFKLALRKPEMFAAAASMSGVLDIASRAGETKEERSDSFYHIFAEQSIRNTEDDLLWLIQQGENSNQPKPKLYQCCGTEDFLYENNRKFYEIVEKTNYDLTTEWEPGDHQWDYWDQKIQDVLNWLPLKSC